MEPIKTYATHFCGLGGACYGLEQAGLECKFAIDWLDYAVEWRERNLGHKAVCGDISKYEPLPEHETDLLWTSPPCQTFSSCSRELAEYQKEDYRNNLFQDSLRSVKILRPRFVVLENVMGLITHEADGLGQGTLTRMREALEELGYHVEWNVLNSLYFGLPQERERVFIIASRDGETGLIPDDIAGQVAAKENPPKFSDIAEWHTTATAWGSTTYKTAIEKIRRLVEKNGSSAVLRITIVEPGDCLPTVTCGWGGGPTRKKVAIVDKTIEGVHFLRSATVREGARAQGFPDSWKFPVSTSEAWTLVGNAVSSPVAKAIGRHLIQVSMGEKPRAKKTLSAKRVASYAKRVTLDTPPHIAWDVPCGTNAEDSQ